MKLPNDTCVIVADSEKFLLLRNIGDEDIMDLRIREHEEQENPPTREQAANRPGRVDDSMTNHRSAYEDTDWHELEKERFASDLADRLFEWVRTDRIRSLVLVADPKTLGHLREALHESVTKRVVGEIDKNLTNHPLKEIEKVIRASEA